MGAHAEAAGAATEGATRSAPDDDAIGTTPETTLDTTGAESILAICDPRSASTIVQSTQIPITAATTPTDIHRALWKGEWVRAIARWSTCDFGSGATDARKGLVAGEQLTERERADHRDQRDRVDTQAVVHNDAAADLERELGG